VCEQIICDAHDKSFTKIKVEETYALSVKTEQSNLRNWIIQFYHQNHRNRNIQAPKKETVTEARPAACALLAVTA
jgi:hypothetical protein